MLEARAIYVLRPDLEERIVQGEVEFADIRDEIVKKYWQVVWERVKQSR